MELTDAGEIFPDKPTVMLVTDYPVSSEKHGDSQQSPFIFFLMNFLEKSKNNT